MITIVSDLMVELVRCGMQAQHPVESPECFVEKIGNAVRTRLTESVELVGVSWRELESEQHLGGGVAGRQEIFQLIAGVVPAAGGVDIGSGR